MCVCVRAGVYMCVCVCVCVCVCLYFIVWMRRHSVTLTCMYRCIVICYSENYIILDFSINASEIVQLGRPKSIRIEA